MELDDLEIEEEPELEEFARPVNRPPKSAASQHKQISAARGALEDGEVGRYARKPDNRDTVAHYTNFGNRATHANKDLVPTGVVRGAEVGQVKLSPRKAKKKTMSQQSAADLVAFGLEKPSSSARSTLKAMMLEMFKELQKDEKLAQAPEPTKRHMTLVDNVLGSMNIPPEAKKDIKQQPDKIKLSVVQTLSNFVPVKPPSRRQRTLSREPRSPRESKRREDIVDKMAKDSDAWTAGILLGLDDANLLTPLLGRSSHVYELVVLLRNAAHDTCQ